MLKRYVDWWAALGVLVVTGVLVTLDISDASVARYWSRHSFTSSVLSGVLVLLLTVLIVDQVARIRQLRNRSRAIAAQAAIIIAQATRVKDAIGGAPESEENLEEASEELRTYAQMLLVSAPVLIDAALPRSFLEAAERFAARLARALRQIREGAGQAAGTGLDEAMEQLRAAAAPLLRVLSRDERAAVGSGESEAREE